MRGDEVQRQREAPEGHLDSMGWISHYPSLGSGSDSEKWSWDSYLGPQALVSLGFIVHSHL